MQQKHEESEIYVIQRRNVKYNKNMWRIITVYSRKIKKNNGVINRSYFLEKEENCLIIGEDFNAKIRNRRRSIEEKEKVKKNNYTRSIDKVINRDGCILISKIEERE